jgi:hypothetical protein
MSAIGMTYVRTFPNGNPEPLVAGSELGEVEYEISRDRWIQAQVAQARRCLDEPPGREEFSKGAQEAAGDREPGAAEEGEDRHQAVH